MIANTGKPLIRDLQDPEITFELVYLRHNYFRKTTNPTDERMGPFSSMVKNITGRIYLKNIEVFKKFGLEFEDLESIGNCHVVSFIGMQGLYENVELMEKFILRHKSIYGSESMPTENEIMRKESYDLARFLKQRLQECANMCRNRNKNIVGNKDGMLGFISDNSQVDTNPSDENLRHSPEYFGYKLLTSRALKIEIKTQKANGKSSFISTDGRKIRVVFMVSSPIQYEDAENTPLDYRDNLTLKDPEELMILAEEGRLFI